MDTPGQAASSSTSSSSRASDAVVPAAAAKLDLLSSKVKGARWSGTTAVVNVDQALQTLYQAAIGEA
jgi:hypothetical protein